jgi:hypothetical protein
MALAVANIVDRGQQKTPRTASDRFSHACAKGTNGSLARREQPVG